MFTTLILSRIQFGFTIGFHILFPTLNIGLAIFICIFEGIWLKTQNPKYLQICKFWTKIFALTFGMGVVSGVVLSYELGTNFNGFTNAVGEVLGPLFAYEVMSAFFLEAGFLGIMLFGWKKVNPKIHYSATLLVTIGTIISAFWILSANSWMQTPTGYYLIGNKFIVKAWSEVIFNPSFIPRFIHMILAALLTTCFVITGISSWYILKKRAIDLAKPCLAIAICLAAIVGPLQLFVGDLMGLNIYHYQPLKTAAIEANWNTMQGAPFVVFAIPSSTQGKNLFEVKIPYGASLINTHSFQGTLIGLNSVPKADQPVVAPTFFGFRIMVAIGMLFILTAWMGAILLYRKALFTKNWFLRLCIWISPLGFIAAIAGWITAESGRQPWIVYGLMRTANAASNIPMEHVLISLMLFIVGYGFVFSFYLYYLFKTIRKGPEHLEIPTLTLGYMPQPNDEVLDDNE
ncbi:MAG: cytochrome ubiquinol oxidase subunit I [Gammaproteobacteria bacterium]|nr:cytochrome ubiquinol oxidase subunit I [Gammaproteobacteria bacterium]